MAAPRGGPDQIGQIVVSGGALWGCVRILLEWIQVTPAKRTKKVGIVGKYGTRYGASLRKMAKKIEITQHAKYTCTFCGKETMKRTCVGIWKCRSCAKTVAGGAYVYRLNAMRTPTE
ncbi:hypothetical protein HPB47_008555 [Ixodes persulcatus]|uniref:Uncharacterized protein n=1 Tax=Ixodes persulcatus TaxID=34615 RepID=A0AC60P4H3_IXOPE|nr:hypothetical protein HPB47_008555 [Ixodes persulcatus]